MTTPGPIVWITGLPGSGKSTIARLAAGATIPSEVLDGDEVRASLWPELGFSREDRDENIRRIGILARVLSRHGVTVFVAAVSPYRAARDECRLLAPGRFLEVFCDCPLDILIDRDPKGLYRRAAAGEIRNLTGVGDPYETPTSPEILLHTGSETLEESLSFVLRAL